MACCAACSVGSKCLGESNMEPSVLDQLTKSLTPLIQTGVSIWGTTQNLSLQKDANKAAQAQANAQMEALRIQNEIAQANATAALNAQRSASYGLSTGAMVGIGVGAAVLLGGMALLAARR